MRRHRFMLESFIRRLGGTYIPYQLSRVRLQFVSPQEEFWGMGLAEPVFPCKKATKLEEGRYGYLKVTSVAASSSG